MADGSKSDASSLSQTVPSEVYTMTNREREYADAGFGYCEGIENAKTVIVPSTGRTITQIRPGVWEAQPWNDNYYQEFTDLLAALKFATKPTPTDAESRAFRRELEWEDSHRH